MLSQNLLQILLIPDTNFSKQDLRGEVWQDLLRLDTNTKDCKSHDHEMFLTEKGCQKCKICQIRLKWLYTKLCQWVPF